MASAVGCGPPALGHCAIFRRAWAIFRRVLRRGLRMLGDFFYNALAVRGAAAGAKGEEGRGCGSWVQELDVQAGRVTGWSWAGSCGIGAKRCEEV